MSTYRGGYVPWSQRQRQSSSSSNTAPAAPERSDSAASTMLQSRRSRYNTPSFQIPRSTITTASSLSPNRLSASTTIGPPPTLKTTYGNRDRERSTTPTPTTSTYGKSVRERLAASREKSLSATPSDKVPVVSAARSYLNRSRFEKKEATPSPSPTPTSAPTRSRLLSPERTSRFLGTDKQEFVSRPSSSSSGYSSPYRPTTLSVYGATGRSLSSSFSRSSQDSPSSTRPTTPSSPGTSAPSLLRTVTSPVSTKAVFTFGTPCPPEKLIPACKDGDSDYIIWVTMVTRSTSPTAPSPSFYLRSRRADQARTLEKEVKRPTSKPERFERSCQTDETITRWSRHINSTAGGWTLPANTSPRFPRVGYRESGTSPTMEETPKSIPLPDEAAKCIVKMGYIEPEKVSNTKQTGIKFTLTKPEVNRSISTSSESSDSTKSGGNIVQPTVKTAAVEQTLPMREARRSPNPEVASTSDSSSESSSDDEKKNDRPPRPPAPPPKKEEYAKSFLKKALGPVTNLFRSHGSKSPDVPPGSCPSATDEERSTTSKSSRLKSETDCSEKETGHRQSSGERAWWLESLESIPGNMKKSPSNKTINKDSDRDSVKSERRNYKLVRQYTGEKPWWMESAESIPGSLRKSGSTRSLNKEEKRYKIRKEDSGERAWWLDSSENIPEGIVEDRSAQTAESDRKYKITYQRSGERAWWMGSTDSLKKNNHPQQSPQVIVEDASDSTSSESSEDDSKVRDPAPARRRRPSPSDDTVASIMVPTPPPRTSSRTPKRPKDLPLFIGGHTNIDDILGSAGSTPAHSPVLSRPFVPPHSEEPREVLAEQVRIHDSVAHTADIQRRQTPWMIKLDDTALQLYKDGDLGSYLDLEASISEQQEEFENFHSNRKNSIVLRTQLSVRVHTIIEKLLTSEGRDLRRALFSLKQIFQEDKDLVHEFVQNEGLSCLVQVGSEADQKYQNYILRALGQVMLYVDGMNGVMNHPKTVQWLYALIASRFRLVAKTALKLLLVFIEYTEGNGLLLIEAVHAVDNANGCMPWSRVIRLLQDYDSADTELLVFAMTLLNKTLNSVPDQDTYYDQVDLLEEQGMAAIIQRYMSRQGTDLDLLRQFQIYEAVLQDEDDVGCDRGAPLRQLDDSVRKALRNRKTLTGEVVNNGDRRRSRRHSTGTSPSTLTMRLAPAANVPPPAPPRRLIDPEDDDSSSSQSSQALDTDRNLGGNYKGTTVDDAGVTPALKRRRERSERQRCFQREQQESAASFRSSLGIYLEPLNSPTTSPPTPPTTQTQPTLPPPQPPPPPPPIPPPPSLIPGLVGLPDRVEDGLTPGLTQRLANGTSGVLCDNSNMLLGRDRIPLLNAMNRMDSRRDNSWVYAGGEQEDTSQEMALLRREGTVKDLTNKLAAHNILNSPDDPNKSMNRSLTEMSGMAGIIAKAKDGLAKSNSKKDIVVNAPPPPPLPLSTSKPKSETELHWEELVANLSRSLQLCDLDFTDLQSDDENDVLSPVGAAHGMPPPPPSLVIGDRITSHAVGAPPPPPPNAHRNGPPAPPTTNGALSNTSHFGSSLSNRKNGSGEERRENGPPPPPPLLAKKTKKTVKLFWKEVRDDVSAMARARGITMIWDELSPVDVDTQKLEHLFESRAKDLITKKQQEMNKNKEIIVLDHKRSNAINIGMTKLPPPRAIKTAILKMDATVMNREGIEKLLTMLPTEDECTRIQEAQAANPDTPLGSAEQFLVTLASISELPARLKLWAFKLDYDNCEKEIAEPLMDLKQGMETLRNNKTFRCILRTLLSIGIFLNGNQVKGFQIEYLAKVPEVKDTVHKHSLLHHLCHMVMEKFPDASDLYGEIGAITRASKVDFDELATNILRMESECKASWDRLKLVAKHDGSTMVKVKMSDFLADCAERIIVLSIVHRRVMNRYRKFLLWVGVPVNRFADMKPNEFCRIISEFALEYRTTRERVLQQMQKKANHRERNKTRGKMITEVGKFQSKEIRADAELRQILGSDISDVESIQGTQSWRRLRKDHGRSVVGPFLSRDETGNGDNLTDGDDEILESLVKTATKVPAARTVPRERKRTRNADRKSLRRTLKNGLSDEDRKHLAAYIKSY